MNPSLASFRAAAAAGALLILSAVSAHAQFGGRGGPVGTPGLAAPAVDLYHPLSMGRTFTDLELTAITRAQETPEAQATLGSIAKLGVAAMDARTALTAAAFTDPVNRNDLTTKAGALAAAEQALANARATALLPLVKNILPKAPTQTLQMIATIMENRAVAGARAAMTASVARAQ